jgi:hypothetical protein
MVAKPRLLLVAQPLRLLGERVVIGAHGPRGDLFSHAVLEHHRAGEISDALEVVGGTVGHGSEDDLFGRAAREHDLHQVDQLLLRLQVAVLLRRVQRVSQGAPARDDRDLLHGLRVADEVGHERVAGLVVGEYALLLIRDDAPLLQSGDNALHRVFEVCVLDLPALDAAGEDGRLVADVGEVGAREAGGLARDRVEIDVLRKRLAARVDLEDRLTPREIGWRDEDLAIEASGAEEGGVEVLEPVGGSDDDDAIGPAETVELDE